MGEKCLAIAKITDPTAVAVRYSALYGGTVHDGAIFCHIPEIGLEGDNFVYCRYGLSIPYIRVQPEKKLWIEPTMGDTERWIYTGFADAGGASPDSTMQMLIDFVSQVIYASTSNTLHFGSKSASEAFVKGTAFKTELDKHKKLIQDLQTALSMDWATASDMSGSTLKANLKAALATFLADPLPDYSQILSTELFGK